MLARALEEGVRRNKRAGRPEQLLNEEMECYRRSVDLSDNAIMHCYLSECLFEAGSASESGAHVARALQMSPRLPLALKLGAGRDSLSSSA
jgi:hypothetical protein